MCFAALAAQNVAKVTVSYSGLGDSG
jgi:hypothetical protein